MTDSSASDFELQDSSPTAVTVTAPAPGRRSSVRNQGNDSSNSNNKEDNQKKEGGQENGNGSQTPSPTTALLNTFQSYREPSTAATVRSGREQGQSTVDGVNIGSNTSNASNKEKENDKEKDKEEDKTPKPKKAQTPDPTTLLSTFTSFNPAPPSPFTSSPPSTDPERIYIVIHEWAPPNQATSERQVEIKGVFRDVQAANRNVTSVFEGLYGGVVREVKGRGVKWEIGQGDGVLKMEFVGPTGEMVYRVYSRVERLL